MEHEETARCLCGAVELRLSGEPLTVTYCHCGNCRRATGGPLAVFVGYETAQIAYPNKRPRSFASSPGIDRPFCPDCGTRIGYADAELPGRLYLHIGILDRPERCVPQWHAFERERLPWLNTDDDLPRHDTFSIKRPDAERPDVEQQGKTLESCG